MIGSELTSAVGFGSELAVTLTKPAKRPNLEREGLVGERTCIVNFDAVFCDPPRQCRGPPAPTMPARFTPCRDDRYILPSVLFVQTRGATRACH